MRIKKIELDGVGPFVNATFEIPEPARPDAGELVLFEGPNGSGKTSLTEAIVSAMRVKPSERFVSSHFPRECRALLGLNDDQIMGFRVGVGPLRVDYQVRGHSPLPVVYSYNARLATPNVNAVSPDERAGTEGGFAASDSRVEQFGQWLLNQDYRRKQYFFEAERGSPELRSEAMRSVVSIDTFFERLENVLQRFIDMPVKIMFSRPNEIPRGPWLRFGESRIEIDRLGEGLRSTLSWVIDLLMCLETDTRLPSRPEHASPLEQEFWLVLDEVEESLHPKRQAQLFPLLRETFPRARIYATTHSPFVVASVTEGYVFRIRPEGVLGRVTGAVACEPLRPGQTLEWVVREIFDAPDTFVDPKTRELLALHQQLIDELRRGNEAQWDAFLDCRAELASFESEVVDAVTAMREVPLRAQIRERAKKRADAAGHEAPA